MSDIPSKGGKRKPTPKKTFSLSDYKKKINDCDFPFKETEWLKTSQAMQEATGLPGFPKGYTSLARGFSNTGKSTSVLEAIVAAQKGGDLPIIFDLENNIGRYRLGVMGFDWDGDYIKIDNEFLVNEFSKKRNKDLTEASIEDLAACIHSFLNDQEAGKLPYDLVFAIDSIGVLNCNMSIAAQIKSTSDNNQWNAGAYEHAFKSILNTRIPLSKKTNKEFTNTIIAVQKIWIDNMGAGVVKHKGGEAFFFGSRLIFHHGGIKSSGTKMVSATSLKKSVAYGVQTKVTVAKNHIDGELGGLSMEGELISTIKGFISPDKIEDYKKDNILFFRKMLGSEVSAEEIKTKFAEISKSNDDQELNIDGFNEEMKSAYGDQNDLKFDPETGEVLE